MTRLTKFGLALCLAGAGIGVIGLAGWLTGIEPLITVVPGQPPMMPNTAIGLALVGVAGALRHLEQPRRWQQYLSAVAAIVVLLIGLGTITEYAFHLQIGLDQLFFGSQRGPYPGRPSPPTAVALSLLATAILFFDSGLNRGARPTEWLILSAAIISVTVLLGQLFGVGPLYRFGSAPVIGVAVHTALSLTMTSLGLLLQRPESGIVGIFAGSGPGALLLRRLGPLAVIAPAAIGLIAARLLQIPGIENIDLADVLFAALTVVSTVASLGLLAITAVRIDRMHDALEQARAQTKGLIEQASDGIFIANLDGRYTDVNEAGCRMLGYSRNEILGKTIVDLIPPGDEKRLWTSKDVLLKGGIDVGEWMLRRKDGSYLPVEVSAKILPDGRWQGFVRDISERKRAENMLRESEERLRRVSDNAAVGLTRCTRDWHYVSANPAYAEIAGKPLDQIVGRSMVEVMSPEGREAIRPYVERVLRGEHVTFESRVPFSGAGQRYLQASYVPDTDANGRIIGWVACVTDITALKRAEEALRESEERFRLFMDNSPTIAWIKDEEGRYVYLSGTYERRHGVWMADWRGRTDAELWPADIASEFRKNDLAVLAADRPIEIIEETRNPDGSRCFWLNTKFPFHDAAGRRYIAGIGLDITARKRAEEALQFSEAKFAGMVSMSADAIVSIDETQRIILFNDGAEKIFGRSKAEMIGTPLDILLPERFRQAHAQHIQGFLAGPDVARPMGERSGKVYGLRANGEEFPADAAISKLSIGGKTILSVTLRDVTEADRLYRAATRATQARDEVLAVVAHDLRNPLQIISTNASILTQFGPEPARPMGTDIGNAVRRMNRLIQDLLDITSMESGHLSLRPGRISAAEVISESYRMQMPLAESASVKLRLAAPPVTREIWADRERVLQVFENLIGNALKFAKAGGHVTMGMEEGTDEIVFSVEDSGPGIAEGDLPHVFDRFWQASKSSRRGIGLGLAIVKGIVEAHDGRIWVQSAPGRGTTFFFSIPALPQARRRLEEQPRRVNALPMITG